MEGPVTPVAAAEDALSHLVIEGPVSGAVNAAGSKDPELPPAISNLLVPTATPAIKKVNWGVSTPGIEDRVALGDGEPTANGDLFTCEGSNGARSGDGIASVEAEVGDGNEAEDGGAEESSSDEEDNDEGSFPDDDDSSVSEGGENSNIEVKYSEEDLQNLVDEFFQAEQEAIEAQERLEDESLKETRVEVSLEFSETKSGPELEVAVEEEMATYIEEWEEKLVELEDQIALLQEKLEEAGLDLAHLYKLFEKEVPEFCTTEAWRKRTHWAGMTPTSEVFEVIERAELDLKKKRPVRRHHGRIQDEGASGFLVTKVKAQTPSDEVPEDGWSLYDVLEDKPGPGSLMGTEKWATVYLAETPEQAAQMGLGLPGVDTVEEIGDLDADKSKLFKEALASEGQQSLSEKQKIIMKKVCEEDDVKKTKKLQRKLLPPRPRKPRTHAQKKGATYINGSGATSSGAAAAKGSLPDQVKNLKIEGDADLLEPVLDLKSLPSDISPPSSANSHEQDEDEKGNIEKADSEPWIIDMAGVVHPRESQGPDLQNGVVSLIPSKQSKRRLTPTEIDPETNDAKRKKTVVMIDSDGEHEVEEFANENKSLKDNVSAKDASGDLATDLAEVIVLGSRKDSSQKVQLEDLSGNWLISEGGDNHSQDESVRYNTRKRLSSSRFFRDTEVRNFSCTACGMLLKNREVMKHPSLDVGICRKCKNFLFSGPFNKDADGHEDECRWCGQGGDVLCCESCDKVFCCPCIKRNLGEEECNRIADSDDWRCFFCNKQPLHNLRLQYQAVKDALKAQQADTEDDFVSDRIIVSKKRNRRRNIRKVLDDGELDERTKHLLALEKERQERLEAWRAKAKVNGRGSPAKLNRYNRNVHTSDELLGMDEDDIAEEGFILNKARADDEEPVRICPYISHFLRPHQLAGMRFMWENCIESVSKVKSGVDGFGCILAHSMGLGKTLQVIGFVHTVLKKIDLGLRTVLIVVPVNVLHNWKSEFHKWQPGNEATIPVFMLEDVARDNSKRANLLTKWKTNGGVMLIGYASFRTLLTGKTVKEKCVRDSLCVALQDPGPDILVCDEAHQIKNDKADITQALRQVRTHRRIALTGSPLQNNLQEYYCMVNFVREGFLGPLSEFRRRFSTPIENGQRVDSTSRDVTLMKFRVHILHKQLQGFVQRKTMNVLKDELPSKCVYIISVRLSPLQRSLYLKFLQMNGLLDNGKPQGGSILFQAYHTLAKIWNHPHLLILAQEKDLRKEDSVENFIVDKDDDVPNVVDTGHGASDGRIVLNDDIGVDGTVKETGPVESKSNSSNNARTVCRADGNHADVAPSGWWKDLMEGQPRESVEMSGKMVILMKILALSSAKSDKALVFSQSLHTLDLIEVFLENMPCLNGSRGNWKKNIDWYRLDGQTSAKARQDLVENFNDPENTCVQCVLISTRAGSLGINLPAANRVIIFDGSWNPTHDLQALFRAWRFGQKKNVYAYRLLASGTMEEKIYNRQVAKEGLAARVLDEHQVARHFNMDDLDFFLAFDDDGDCPEDEDNSQSADVSSTSIQEEPAPVLSLVKPKRAAFSVPNDAPPRDDVMGRLLLEYRPKWIGRYHEHEPLLEDLEDEKLSKEEQALAWESFQHEESVPQSLAPSTPGVPHVVPLPTFQHYPVSTFYNPLPVQSNSLPIPQFPSSSHVPNGCSVEKHVLQLKEENIQLGSASVCGLCNVPICWETISK